MAEAQVRAVAPELLHYRPWQGAALHAASDARAAWRSVWAITRTALAEVFRRWLFWGLYGLALLIFGVFFIGQYLMAWAATQVSESDVRVGGLGRADPRLLVDFLRGFLKLNGSAETYRNLFWYEGYTVMIVLAMAGAILIGNDLRYASLPFYLSKPISRWQYLLGKGLAVAAFVNLFTTLPALVLFVQYGLLEPGGSAREGGLLPGVPAYAPSLAAVGLLAALALLRWRAWPRLPLWVVLAPAVVPVVEFIVLESGDYFHEQAHLALGIIAYGLVLSASLTLVLLATATWLQRTVPLIMTWTTLLLFCRLMSSALVERLNGNPRWRLIDLWNNTYLVGSACLGIPRDKTMLTQPAWQEAALVLGTVSLLCLSYLVVRIRGVEVVR